MHLIKQSLKLDKHQHIDQALCTPNYNNKLKLQVEFAATTKRLQFCMVYDLLNYYC